MVTRALLAKELKERSGLPYTTAAACVDILLERMFSFLTAGEGIELRGFGSFGVKTGAARKTSINGQTAVPEHGRVFFRPGEQLRRAVWNCRQRRG